MRRNILSVIGPDVFCDGAAWQKLDMKWRKWYPYRIFLFLVISSYLAEARKKSYASWRKLKKSWSCFAEQFCDLHMTCAVLVWKDDESGFVEFWFFFHHLLLNTKCNVYSIQKYFNKISFFHFFFLSFIDILFNKLLD